MEHYAELKNENSDDLSFSTDDDLVVMFVSVMVVVMVEPRLTSSLTLLVELCSYAVMYAVLASTTMLKGLSLWSRF